MAKISLRTYNREIEGLIEHGQQLDEAIAHCRHILRSYSKHLETYRLLGKAYLEAKRYDQAVDIFQRVLVAAPDDFVSHVGMSIIADDKGKLDDAIWHMERAFEVQPSNAAIQGELQRLFGRRDGVEPPKIRLTRGALAHMYVQGELYTQAISEIRAVLSNDPKRTDMQTLLARAYFRNGQRAEATDLCTELLSRYPYCLDANRLMVEILPGTQRAEDAQEYRQRVIELDPYAAFAQDSIFRSDSVADNLVTLDRLEYTGENTEGLGSLGIGLDSDATQMSRASAASADTAPGRPATGELPAWLSGSAGSAAMRGAANPPATATGKPDDLPEFLRDAGWNAAPADAVSESSPAFSTEGNAQPAGNTAIEGDLPEWVRALAPTGAGASTSEGIGRTSEENAFRPPEPMGQPASTDTPDWLRNLGAEESVGPSAAMPEAVTPGVSTPDWLRDLGPSNGNDSAAGVAESAAPSPDWLRDLAGRELDEPAAPSKPSADQDWLGQLRDEQVQPMPAPATGDESPDWLKEFGNDLETPLTTGAPPSAGMSQPLNAASAGDLGSLGTSAQEQDDAMAWLEGLAAKHGAKPEELVTDPNARTEVAPDWVDKAAEIGEQKQAPVPVPSMDETGIWLRNLETEASETVAQGSEPEAPEDREPLDFRSSFADQNDFAGQDAELEKEDTSQSGDRPTPDWMSDFAPKPPARQDIGDAPDWLRGVSDQPIVPEPPPSRRIPEANVPTKTLPRLPQAEAPVPAEPAAADAGTGDLPSWLAGLDNEESMSPQEAGGKPSEGLPAWLHSDMEPEPEAKEPANPADWRPVHPESLTVDRSEAASVAPEESSMRSQVERPPVDRGPIPARPKPVSPPARAATGSLVDAQSQLGRGNIAAALDIYTKLIRKGKSLEDIIRDLRDALYRYPVEVPLWQSLGDAYMRANRLQEALDAYTKAEELLR